MQGDLISRSELLKLFPVNLKAPFWHVTGIRAAIGAMDAVDAVPVVRCRECKHRGGYHCPMYHTETSLDDLDGFDDYSVDKTDGDGFCERGEKVMRCSDKQT